MAGATSVSTLGRYRLVNRLGEGGMGVVHLGIDATGRAYAIKVLRPHIAHDPDARARLSREVSTLQRVRHPLVAEVIDADVEGELPYVVTRFVPGPGLDEVVRERGALTPTRLVSLGRGLSSALGAIHAAGVVHRDLKPANVLMLDDDPVVIDFGIAHVADDVRLTSVGLVMGTPGYLSPEVIDGESVGPATDWWGWAATLAFAASGRPPFGRGPTEVVLDRVCRGEPDLDGVDPRLRPLLRAGLDVDPSQRPSATEVLAGIDRYAAGSTAPIVLDVPRETRLLPARAPQVVLPAPVAQAPAPVPSLSGASPARPPRPRRPGTLLAVAAALFGLAVAWPLIAGGIALALMVLARTVDRSHVALSRRRYERGVRRSDGVVAALSSPWHLLGAALATVVGSVVPLMLAVGTAFVVGLGVTGRSGVVQPGSLPAVGAASLVALLASWWGPGGTALRRGGRAVVRAVVPQSAALTVVLLLLAVSAASALVAAQHGTPDWIAHQLPFGVALP